MKELTPFLHSILFKKRFESFDQYQNVFSTWTFPHESTYKSTIPVIESINQEKTEDSLGHASKEIYQEKTEIKDQEIPIPIQPQPIQQHSNRFFPKKPDSLFWSMFVGQYGKDEFFQIESKYMNREIEEKLKIIDYLKSNNSEIKPLLKSLRITAIDLKEMMADFMTNKATAISTIPAFVLYYKRPIWIIREKSRSYLKIMCPDMDEPPILVYKEDKHKYTYLLDYDTNVTDTIQNEYILLDKYNKVMKGASNYRSKDLDEMVQKINYDGKNQIDSTLKKQDLFVALARFLQEDWLINV